MSYDACGWYFDYKGYTVIQQDHPKLIKYQITKEVDGELMHVGLATTQQEAREFINGLLIDNPKPKQMSI